MKFAACLTLFALLSWNPPQPAYLNVRLPVEQRVDDLLKRMTLAEKIGQMCQFVGPEHMKAAAEAMQKKQSFNKDAYSLYPGLTPADVKNMVKQGLIGSFLHILTLKETNELQTLAQESRLKIPLLIGIDAIHGNGMVAGSTIYPSPISLAATWDTALVRQIARETALEMRATGSQWAFSPNLDIARDARWGRVGETFGEDPLLVTQMGLAVINGLQSQNVLACAKHLVAGSQPINGLNVAPTDISERTLREIFLPPYVAAVKAGVATVMPAHNEINGVPGHSNKALMTGLLRNQWHFKGFYVSDFLDIERLALVHQSATDQQDAVYQTLDAGMDMHMHGPGFLEPIQKLIDGHQLSESRIDESVRRILTVKFQLGLFESPYVSPDISTTVYTPEHRATALDAARKSIVLLKNKNLLPLDHNYRNILVLGPNANNQAILGDWTMQQPDEHITTILEGIQTQAPPGTQVHFFDVGNSTVHINEQKITEAVLQATQSDLIVVAVGENALRSAGKDRTSGENVDRDNIDLLGNQLQLIQQLSQTGKPIVAVLINGRPLSIPWLDAHLPAIVEAWEPGEAGGQAVAEILFGKTNPSGKLAISFPRSVGQIPVYYNHKPSQNLRQYIGTPNTPLYEFGYGLNYSTFKISDISLDQTTLTPTQSISVSARLTNTGSRSGTETVQIYLHSPGNGLTRPVKELKAFSRQEIQPGQSKTLRFTLGPDQLASYNLQLKKQVQKGIYTIMVGNSSRDTDLQNFSFTVN